MELEGRVALITGGARRVGRAIALRLARARCNVAVHYLGSEGDAADTVRQCRALGADTDAFSADLADPVAISQLVAAVVNRFARLDILVNNASVFATMSLSTFDLAEWDRTLRINLTAPLLLAHAARTALGSARGRIVNLCDAAIVRPDPAHLAYVVSKAALEALTRTLARALAPNVNVVGIAPGVAAWPEDYDEATRARLTAKIPLKRAGTVDDIANAVHFVLREGDYITGAILPVDGGRHLA